MNIMSIKININEFISLNRKKISFFKWTPIVVVLFVILMRFSLCSNTPFSFHKDIFNSLTIVICLNLIVILIGVGPEYYLFLKRQRFFSNSNFITHLFTKQEFRYTYLYKNSSSKYAEKCMFGYIKTYPVVIRIASDVSTSLTFSFRLKWMKLTKEEIKIISNELVKYNSLLDIKSINIAIKTIDIKSYNNIMNILLSIVEVMETYGFKPENENEIDFNNLDNW